MSGHGGRGVNPPVKDPIRMWVEKGLQLGNLFTRDKTVLADLSDLPQSSLSTNVRHWFAGTAPLLPITEPTSCHPGLPTTLTRILIAAVMEKDASAAAALLERARALAAASLHETGSPFEVIELAAVLADDDDELVVALDAVIRKAENIRHESPLHPTRFVLATLQMYDFSAQALLDLLIDDTGGKAAFSMVYRLYEWLTGAVGRASMREAARSWRARNLWPGGWREQAKEEEEERGNVDDQDDEGEGDEERASDDGDEEEGGGGEEENGSEDEEEEEEGDEEMEEQAEPEPEGDEGRQVDDDDANWETVPFLIHIVQMAGKLEVHKKILLPAQEEPRELLRPKRIEAEAEEDVWPRLLQMSRRLSAALQRHAKNRKSKLREESRELANAINDFLEAENGRQA